MAGVRNHAGSLWYYSSDWKKDQGETYIPVVIGNCGTIFDVSLENEMTEIAKNPAGMLVNPDVRSEVKDKTMTV